MTTEQIYVRLPRKQLDAIDELVRRGIYPNRAAAVREGVAAVTELHRRRDIDAEIVTGYERVPPTPAEDASALESLRNAILEEPW